MADRTIEYKVIIDTSTGKSSITDLNGNLVESEKLTKQLGDTTKQSTEGRLAGIRDLSVAYQGVKSVISDVVQTVSVFIEAANRNNLALKGLAESARVFGQDQQKANEYAKALANDGLMTLSSSAGTLKMLMASGFNISEAMELSKSLKDIGAFNNVVGDLNAAMYDVARGIKTGSVELIENIGFTQRLSSVMKQANIDISAGIDITNNLTQRRALYNAIQAEGQKFEGNAARLAEESAAAYTQLGKAWEKLKAAIGDVLNEVFVPLAKILSQLALGAMKDLPVLLGLAAGAAVALIAPVISLTGSVAALGAAVTAATGGLNLLIAAGAAITVGGIAYVATMDNSTDATNKNTEATKENAKAKAELTTSEQSFVEEVKKIQESLLTENEKAIKSEEDKLKKIQELRATYAETFRNSGQKTAELEELARLEIEQTKKLNEAKTAETTKFNEEAAAKRKAEEDAIFAENQAFANEETARLKAEQDKRIADNQAFLVKQQADQDAANDEMAMREIEAAWIVAEETKKAAKAKSDAEKKAQQDKAEYQKQGLKDSLNNLQALKTLGSDAAKIAKGAAVASATIDTIESAGKSYKWGASWGGPVGGAVMAAIAVAAGVARVAQITATGTGFQSGGYTGDVPENQTAGTVHGREFVMNAETTRRVGVSTLSAIQAGVPVSVLPSSQFAGSATSAGLNNVAGSVQALNMNMVNGAMPAPIIEINANTDLINFEIKRREASNEVDKTGRSFDNVS